jgi:hypothetical protein
MNKKHTNKKLFAKDELSLLSTVQFIVFLGGIFLYIDSLWLHTITETFNFTIPVVGSAVNASLTWLVNNVHHSVWGVLLIWQYLAGHKYYLESAVATVLLAAPIWLLQYSGLQIYPLVVAVTAVLLVLVYVAWRRKA